MKKDNNTCLVIKCITESFIFVSLDDLCLCHHEAALPPLRCGPRHCADAAGPSSWVNARRELRALIGFAAPPQAALEDGALQRYCARAVGKPGAQRQEAVPGLLTSAFSAAIHHGSSYARVLRRFRRGALASHMSFR